VAAAPNTIGQSQTPAVSPVAQRLAEQRQVDLSQVHGTGPGGRIVRADIEALTESVATTEVKGPVPAAATASAPEPVSTHLEDGPEVHRRLSRRRLTIARRLVEAQQTAAMLTTFNEIDMQAVVDLRRRTRESFRAATGSDLGYMSFFVKAVVGALKAYPQLNSELRDEELLLKQYYDIGIAISDPEGLVVPVLHGADRLTFAQIEAAIVQMVEKTRNRTLSLDDLRGGTFTITNGGIFGSLLSTPILNPPQVGILGMHKISDRPVAVNGQVVIRPTMFVALTYDHRVIDGREAVLFLVRIKELVEDPGRLLLET
jgi:2-oxoglutarate dehydrogenase E2 component (dihydrolipoamide succinyltransferase)